MSETDWRTHWKGCSLQPGPPGDLLFTNVDEPIQESASRHNHCTGCEAPSIFHNTPTVHPSATASPNAAPSSKVRFSCWKSSACMARRYSRRSACERVPSTAGPFERFNSRNLYPGSIRDPTHETIKCVYFPDKMSLAQSTNRGIAGQLANHRDLVRNQGSAGPNPRCCSCSFTAPSPPPRRSHQMYLTLRTHNPSTEERQNAKRECPKWSRFHVKQSNIENGQLTPHRSGVESTTTHLPMQNSLNICPRKSSTSICPVIDARQCAALLKSDAINSWGRFSSITPRIISWLLAPLQKHVFRAPQLHLQVGHTGIRNKLRNSIRQL